MTARHAIAIADDTLRDVGVKAVQTVRPMPPRHAQGIADAVIAACVPDAVEHAELLRQIDDLRAFEREYRARLIAYIRNQLRELDA